MRPTFAAAAAVLFAGGAARAGEGPAASGPRLLFQIGSDSLRIVDHVEASALSPDGRALATLTEDGDLLLWDARSGALSATQDVPYRVSGEPDPSVAFTADGGIAVATSDGRLLLGRAREGGIAFGRSAGVGSPAAVSGAAGVCVAAGDGRGPGFRVTALDGGKELGRGPEGLPAVRRFVLSADGKRLATFHDGSEVRLWDLPGCAPAGGRRFPEIWARSAAFSPDGTRLAFLKDGRDAVFVWDAAKPDADLVRLAVQPLAHGLAFVGPGGDLLAVGGERAGLLNLSDGRFDECLPSGSVVMASSPDTLVTRGWDERYLRLWDLAGGRVVRERAAGHDGMLYALTRVAWSPDGGTLAVADRKGFVHLLDAKTGRRRRTIDDRSEMVRLPKPARIRGVALSPDGSRLATCGNGGSRVWDTAAGKPLLGLQARAHCGFAPDGRTLLAGDDGTLSEVDPATERVLSRTALPPGEDGYLGVSPSPSGKLLMVRVGERYRDFACGVWSAKGVRVLRKADLGVVASREELSGPSAVSPVDRLLAVVEAADEDQPRPPLGVTLVSLAGGGPLRLAAAGDIPTCVAFSPDSSRVAVGYLMGMVRVWDTGTGRQVAELRAAEKQVSKLRNVEDVCFTPDGKAVAAVLASGTGFVWSIGK